MEERTRSEEVFHGKLIRVRVDTLPEPIGGTQRYEIVEHPDAVAIVAAQPTAVNGGPDNFQVLMVRQQRPAVGKDLWEIPAGLVNPTDGDPMVTAARELREETGYDADVLQMLARELSSPGFTTEAITIFLATGVRPAPGAIAGRPTDTTEIEHVQWVPLDDALRACQSGEIVDGKTLLGLALAANALKKSSGSAKGDSAVDPTNAPNGAPILADDDSTVAAAAGGGIKADTTLKLETMLMNEFNYVSVTAYQAQEDRTRMFNLYLLLIGVVASALGAIYQFGQQHGNETTSLRGLVVLLLALGGVLGFIFLVNLVRFRQAWRQSAIAMNTIKEFYIEQFRAPFPDVEKAFGWRLNTIPAGEKLGNPTTVVCTTVVVLGSICLAGATYEAYDPWLQPLIGSFAGAWEAILFVFFIAVFLQMLFFFVELRHGKDRKAKAEVSARFGSSVEVSRWENGQRLPPKSK
ncbi:MAG: ADP-ribose pyrophosphatase [Ktedonobacterales bacterium]|jgi:ADP-ribose pyrophosphatase|nr:MAG: ADP-ribose pyrophosphatase [Ktedonobacterales bacterium]